MICALVSRKGGVGKTTTAVNLSAALAARGRRVLLVDLDAQASASLSLGVPRHDLAPSAADVLLSGVPLGRVVRPTTTPGLDLVTGSVDLVGADKELAVFRDAAGNLRRALEPFAARYDDVFLDCPPSLSLLPTSALVAADGFLVPVVPQFLAIAGVKNLLSYAERLQGSPRLLGIVLTMADYRNRATRDNVRRIRAEYGSRVFGIEIRINVRLAEAPEQGQTIFQYDPSATGAEAYRLLAEELLLRTGGLAEPLAAAASPAG